MSEKLNLVDRFFRPLDHLPAIETTVGGDELESFNILHVRPAECAPLPWEIVFDALSLHIQYAAFAMLGVKMPDIRFRIITDPHTDGMPGTHFGTFEGAVLKAGKILEQRARENYPYGQLK